jgi:ethanolamine utilization protein EutN
MYTAIVQGTVNATAKHPSMNKGSLLIVQPIDAQTHKPTGLAVMAVDVLGAGLGQKVLVSGDGRGAQDLLGAGEDCPIRTAIVGLIDPPEKK